MPVADRAIEKATVLNCTAGPDMNLVTETRTTVHRSYRCAGCLETFWTTETVQTLHAKAHKIEHLYRNRLR